jgi:predicted kinase
VLAGPGVLDHPQSVGAYDRRPMGGGPHVLLVTGLPGTGKTTLAERVAPALGAPVLGWDWAMAALTPFGPVADAARSLHHAEYHALGWAMVCHAALAQLRRGMSVVLDGLAADDTVARVRTLARDHGGRAIVVLTTCDDEAVHRGRIDGRQRGIPGWYELTWERVLGTKGRWVPPGDVDLVVPAEGDLDANVARVLAALASPATAGGA